MKDLLRASVYVGTYAKYNNGSLYGKWLNLSDYKDYEEFYDACRELHQDETDPELMFQDYENIPDGLICESGISEKVFDLIKEVKDMSDTEREAFAVWFEYDCNDIKDLDADDIVNKFRDMYRGKYDSETDFACEIAEEYLEELPDFAKRYFDYNAFARDLFIQDYRMEDGFVFSRY